MKKIILSTIAITMMLSATAQPTTKTVKLKVVETSDVHGHFFPYDFMEKKPIKGTLSRANTYINKEREKYGKDFRVSMKLLRASEPAPQIVLLLLQHSCLTSFPWIFHYTLTLQKHKSRSMDQKALQ